MELSNINSNMNSMNLEYMNNRLKNEDIKSSSSDNKATELESVVLDFSEAKTKLSDKISVNIDKISETQLSKKNISTQISISNDIKSIVSSTQDSFEKLDTIQPQVQSMMINFNEIARSTSSSSGNQEGKSRSYFDGALGSKPLSTKEIFEAINKQQQILTQQETKLNNQSKELVQNTKSIINEERVISQENSPFSSEDFVQFNENTSRISEVQSNSTNSEVSILLK
ncbi:MAG: hypothetical protein U9Q20_05415 [Campylobacterota bacterium]|nr:hypothetical protein [Campylobacterota bacterium]